MAKVTITIEDEPGGVHIEAYQATVEGETEEFSRAIHLARLVGEWISKTHGAELARSHIYQD